MRSTTAAGAALTVVAVGVAAGLTLPARTRAHARARETGIFPVRQGETGGVLQGRPIPVPGETTARERRAIAAAAQRTLVIRYRAHDGLLRRAFVLLPAWYGVRRHPALPLVIAPHGRGVPAVRNIRLWGHLPAYGGFALVSPEGQGRRLALYSWGDPGEIDDLARMPAILRRALPWLRLDPRRVYAVGGSMGGQETLLLVARHPRLLAGAISFDAPTDLAARYGAFPRLRGGVRLQRLVQLEVGGTPRQDPAAYAARSPLDDARAIARSGVPLQIWWSWDDGIVVDQPSQSGRLYAAIERADPRAPVAELVGQWGHTAEMGWKRRLPAALAQLGLLRLPAPGR